MHYDVFNGDADGLCSLLQLRLAQPQPAATLVSGVKRDIALLEAITPQAGDTLTVLDISLDSNRAPLQAALAAGAQVSYFDHHYAGAIPAHPGLRAHINTAPEVCTALLVHAHLRGAYTGWALVGAYGDNLHATAQEVARATAYSAAQLAQLEELGTLLNYNGYGETLADLHFSPQALFAAFAGLACPLQAMAARADVLAQLRAGYAQDMQQATSVQPLLLTPHAAVYTLPDASWARRVSGVWSNALCNAHPGRAHLVATQKSAGDYVVSIRAPQAKRLGADGFARRYATGGGRAAAAGINSVPAQALQQLAEDFASYYGAENYGAENYGAETMRHG